MPSFGLVVWWRYGSGVTFLVGVVSLEDAEIVVESILETGRRFLFIYNREKKFHSVSDRFCAFE